MPTDSGPVASYAYSSKATQEPYSTAENATYASSTRRSDGFRKTSAATRPVARSRSSKPLTGSSVPARGAPTGPPSWRVGVVPARMGAWRSSLPPSSRPSAATTGRRPSCPRGPTTTRRSSTGSRTTSCGATGSLVARVEEIAEPGSFLVREVLDESVARSSAAGTTRSARSTTCAATGAPRCEERDCGTGRPLPVPLPRLDLRPRRQAHPRQAHRGPRRLHLRGLRPAPIRTETWQGFVFLCFADGVGHAAAPGAARRPRRPVRAVRLHDAALGARRSSTRSAPTGSSSPRTTASATTARACTRSSTS